MYAYGVIMWEILTRKEPYHDKEMMQIVIEVVNQKLRPYIYASIRKDPLRPLMEACWAQSVGMIFVLTPEFDGFGVWLYLS